jgi:hypothetical protein
MKKFTLALLLAATLWAAHPLVAEDPAEKAGQGITLDTRKIEEARAQTELGEPNYGYVGSFGTFEAATKNTVGEAPVAIFVVHQYPRQDQAALGHTKLRYEGPKRLGNVDGWVFATEWDGKNYPSKIFLSAEKIYFGGGVQGYIAADYRNETGWAWKYHPLHRMELLKKGSAGAESR